MEANQILHANILDIIFEGKNKLYGAYALRKTYNKRLTKALLVMLLLIFLILVLNAISSNRSSNMVIPIKTTGTVLQNVKPDDPPLPPPQLPKLPPPPVATIQFTHPTVVDDDLVKATPPDVKQIEYARIDLKTIEGTKDPGIIAPPAILTGTGVAGKPENKKNVEDGRFTPVEIEAQFPGGAQAWQRYIQRAINAQLDEFTENDYGTCTIQFMVDKDGIVSKVQAITMQGSKLAEVAVNAIRKGPKWTPAVQNGRYVTALRIQPVTLLSPDN